VVIASPLEAELVARLRAVDERLEVRFEPELLPQPRYPSDHHGVEGFERSPEQEERFTQLVAGAEVLFGIPAESPERLAWVESATGMHTTSTLHDLGDGMTEVVIHQRHVPETMRTPEARAGFLTSLDKLEDHLAHLSQGDRS